MVMVWVTLKQSVNVVSDAGESGLERCPAGTVTLADSTWYDFSIN